MITLHHRNRAVSEAGVFSPFASLAAESDEGRSASVDSKTPEKPFLEMRTFGEIVQLPEAQQDKASSFFLETMEIINREGYKSLVADAAKISREELEKFDKTTPHLKLKIIFRAVSERLREPHHFLNIAELTAGIIIRRHMLTFNASMCLSPPQDVKETIAKELKEKEIT